MDAFRQLEYVYHTYSHSEELLFKIRVLQRSGKIGERLKERLGKRLEKRGNT